MPHQSQQMRQVPAESAAVRPLDDGLGRDRQLAPNIPDHQIIRCIGSGSYGEVWLARSVTGSYRAIKTIWREDFSEEVHFQREFEGLLFYEPIARNNAGLVHILHIGQQEGEHPMYYYVMELADDVYSGINIEPARYAPRTLQNDLLHYAHTPMPIDVVMHVGCQLARALCYLHEHDLLHRDIKPANIIYCHGHAKLADAGLVVQGTRRSFVGTQGYVPPDGAGTQRADVYALAKVLYEMVTGKDRLDFPDLPDNISDELPRRKWFALNDLICRAADSQLSEKSIQTAKDLLSELERLRDSSWVESPLIVRFWRAMKAWRWFWLLVVFTALILFAAQVPSDWSERMKKVYIALTDGTVDIVRPQQQNASPEAAERALARSLQSEIYLDTMPEGAAVYRSTGDYMGETPYGPLLLKEGEGIMLILRKEGYADMIIRHVAKRGETISLGGEMRTLHPPKIGEVWTDALGNVYDYEKNQHLSRYPVLRSHFARFLQEHPKKDEAKFIILKTSGDVHDVVLTTPQHIREYADWLSLLSEQNGMLDDTHILLAQVDESIAPRDGFSAYRIATVALPLIPITIYSNPAGASVVLNGKFFGITPIDNNKMPLLPYKLELRLPRHKTVHYSGYSTEPVHLNFQMEQSLVATFDGNWFNSLGQQFIPLSPTLMVGATEVRMRDYQKYCEDSYMAQPDPPRYEYNEHYPVVNVSREDARRFAAWLTNHERNLGLIEETDSYRLPTDEEWSMMVGIYDEEGDTPFERNLSQGKYSLVKYPWGKLWPPTSAVANYADESAIHRIDISRIIEGYKDEYPFASPVASFPANSRGLYDLSGNVQEWVDDNYGGADRFQFNHHAVVRGGSFESFHPTQISFYSRATKPFDVKDDRTGFRLVLERKMEH